MTSPNSYASRARVAARCVALVALWVDRGPLSARDARAALGLRDQEQLDLVLARLTYGVAALREDDDGTLWLDNAGSVTAELYDAISRLGWLVGPSDYEDSDDE